MSPAVVVAGAVVVSSAGSGSLSPELKNTRISEHFEQNLSEVFKAA